MGVRTATLIAVLAAAWARPAAAQSPFDTSVASAPAAAVSSAPAVALGQPLSPAGGPWVLAPVPAGSPLPQFCWTPR